MKARFLWTVGLSLGVGCATITPEQQAVVDQVRVANDSGSVSGCQFIRSVTGVERPARWRWEQDVPAITVLRANASAVGGDTVLVTSSATSYRHRADRYGSRAVSFVTMTGDVYRCGVRRRFRPPLPRR